MTLPASYRNDRVGDGTTTIFPYTFKVWSAEEMRVVLTDPLTGVVTEPTSGFSVTGVGEDGGNVVFDVAPADDMAIVLLPTTTYEQSTDLVNETQFFQERIEDGLDKLCRQSQLLKEEASRTLRIPESEAGGSGMVLPTVAQRANKVLGFDSDGIPVAGFSGSSVSTAMEPVVSAATLAAARAQFGASGVILSVKDAPYLASGDGITSDQTAIDAAVATAYATGAHLYWPTGTYLTTASVENFHAVRHFGPGILKRGSDLFYVEQSDAQHNRIYVAASGGSSSNDGLSASQPISTFQVAFNAVNAWGRPVLPGLWSIVAAAGTFTHTTAATFSTPSRNRVVVRGPDAGHPNIPTCLVDGTGGSAYSHGITITGAAYAEVRDIKFQNFVSGGTRIGLASDYRVDLYANNVHADGCDWCGIYGNGTVIRVKGGILNACRSGVVVNGCEHTVGYQASSTADGTQITNSTQSGVYVSRCAVGHVDFCQLTSNAIGIECDTNGRTHANGTDFKLSTVAVRTTTGGIVTESSNVYNDGTGNANTTKYDFRAFSGSDLFLQTAYSEVCVALDTTSTAHTGTVAKTAVRQPWTIPANLFTENSRKLRVKVHGTGQVTAGTVVGIALGGTTINSCSVTGVWGAGLAWTAEIEIWATAYNGQRSSMILSASNLSPRHGHQAGSVNMTTAKTIDVELTLANIADTVTVYRVEVFATR